MIPRKTRLALSVALLAVSSHALALPTGGAVVAGSATIVAPGPGTLTINQGSTSAIINWQGFNVGAGEAVRFIQPSSAAAVLNRVVGANPSSILGSLTANGNVFLVNLNGIVFGAGSQVSVGGGMSLSTSDITNANFLAGNYTFGGQGTAGTSLNGTIVAPAGLSINAGTVSSSGILPGGTVINTGSIGGSGILLVGGSGTLSGTSVVTQGGSITLNGNETTLASTSSNTTGGVSVAVSRPTGTVALSSVTGGTKVTLGSLTPTGSSTGGGAVALTSVGSPVQSGGLALSSKGSAPLATPSSIGAAPAVTGIVAVTSVSLNLQKREVGF